MKAITPIIAIIVLLLITVAMSGAAWTYISGYWTGTVGKQIEVTDAFCVGTNQAKIIVKNIGTNPIRTGDITIMNRSTGADLTESVLWTGQVTPPDYGMVMHLEFEEGSGITAKDTAGNNDGTLGDGTCTPGAGSCPGWAPGRMGGALNFDGVNDYVNTGPTGPNLAEIAGNQLTIAVWIKPSALAGNGYIFSKNGPFGLFRSGSVFAGRVFTSSYFVATGTIPLTTDWNHVAMTYDGSDVRVFVNGISDTSTAVAGGGNLAGDGCAQLGRYNDGTCNGAPANYFQGKIDEVRIYRRVLSLDEIESLAGNFQVQPSDTATLTNICTGRCSYNLILEGRSKGVVVDC